MCEHAGAPARPALLVVPHDDPAISYSAQVGASMAAVCDRTPSRCPDQWWYDPRNSTTDVGSVPVKGMHTTAGPMASLRARISGTEHLVVLGSADFDASTILSLECTTTNADFNQTRSYAIAKADGHAFAEGALFRLRDLRKDRTYDVSLACAGGAQVHIVAFEIDLDGRVLSPGNMLKPQQYLGGGGGSNMDMDMSLSQSPHTTSGPVAAGAAISAMVVSFLIMALALYPRRRLARRRASAGVLPYTLFPDGGARNRLIKKRRILAVEPSGDGLVEAPAGPLPAVEGDTVRSGSDTVVGESLRGSQIISAGDVSDENARAK